MRWITARKIRRIIKNTNESFGVEDVTDNFNDLDNDYCDDEYHYLIGFPHFDKGVHCNYGVFNVIRKPFNFRLFLVFSEYNVNGIRMHVFTRALERLYAGREDIQERIRRKGHIELKYASNRPEAIKWKTSLGEFHREINNNNTNCLTLGDTEYSPRKRDGEKNKELTQEINNERREIFEEHYGSMEVYIPINENFLDEIFRFAECRFTADYLIGQYFKLPNNLRMSTNGGNCF